MTENWLDINAGNALTENVSVDAVLTVTVMREKRKIKSVAVAVMGVVLVPLVAPVTLTRMVCPTSRSLALVKPALPMGTPDCPVRVPVSIEKPAAWPGVRQTGEPNDALVSGELAVKIVLSLKISPTPELLHRP